jgi:polysaccharide chain length determinant protein (PEP-CTERM system associated)
MQKSNVSSFEIEDYLYFLNRRKWFIIIPFILLLLISIFVSIFSPRIYLSYATIQLDQPGIINPLVQGIAVTPSDTMPLSSIKVKLVNQAQIEQTIKTLNLDKNIQNNPLELYKLIANIRSNLDVMPMGPNLIQVSFQGENPQMVMQVVQILVNNFIKESVNEQQQDTMGALNFIQGQVEEYRSKMEAAEADLRGFKEKHFLELPTNITNNLQQLSNAQASLLATNLELQQSKMRLDSLQKQIAGHKEIVVSEITKETNPLVVNLRQKIADLEIQLTTLRGQYTDKHPKIIEIKQEIARTKDKLEQESEKTISKEISSINPLYQNLIQQMEETQIKIETLTAMKKDLEQTLHRLELSVGNMPQQEQELARLTRNSSVYNNLYNLYLNKLEEARASRELELQAKTLRYKILDQPRLPIKPIKPKPLKIIFLGCMLGLVTGLGTAMAVQYLDQTFTSVEELQRFTKIPVLGFISPIVTIEELHRKQRYRVIIISICLIILIAVVILLIKFYPILKPMLSFIEEIRTYV